MPGSVALSARDLVDQPIMRAVLADLAVEAEASLALMTLRVWRERSTTASTRSEDRLVRLANGAGQILDLQARAACTPTKPWNASAAPA